MITLCRSLVRHVRAALRRAGMDRATLSSPVAKNQLVHAKVHRTPTACGMLAVLSEGAPVDYAKSPILGVQTLLTGTAGRWPGMGVRLAFIGAPFV